MSLDSWKRSHCFCGDSQGFLLGLSGVINVLISNGRQIDAVNLAFAFELTEQFCPVSLLKSYLTEARKVSSPVRSGNSSPTVLVCYSYSFQYVKKRCVLFLNFCSFVVPTN